MSKCLFDKLMVSSYPRLRLTGRIVVVDCEKCISASF